MKTDPNKACANLDERFGWALVHDLIAHPLMVATCWADWAVRFHDYTSYRAWPRGQFKKDGYYVAMHDAMFGWLRADHIGQDFYIVKHPFVDHDYVIKADCAYNALKRGQDWFHQLASEFGGDFARDPRLQ